jgi:hypothetical protein
MSIGVSAIPVWLTSDGWRARPMTTLCSLAIAAMTENERAHQSGLGTTYMELTVRGTLRCDSLRPHTRVHTKTLEVRTSSY